MKERMKKVGCLFGFVRGKIRENAKKIIIIGGSILLSLVLAWLSTGFVKVPAQTVQVVRVWQPGYEYPVARAIINDSDEAEIHFTCPWLPGTDIGAKEETYPLNEPLVFNTEIKLFPISALTGNAEDTEVLYMIVTGNIEIVDWDNFLMALDKIKAKWPETSAGSRVDFLEEYLQFEISLSFLNGYLNQNFADYCSRVYVAHRFAEDFELNSPEEIETFLKEQRPWYWVFGPTYFKTYTEQVKRNVLPDAVFSELYSYCYMADEVEGAIRNIGQLISAVEMQKQIIYEGFDETILRRAESVISEFRVYQEERGEEEFPFIMSDLDDFLVQQEINGEEYSSTEIYVIRALVAFEGEKQKLLFMRDYYEAMIEKQLVPYFAQWFGSVNDSEFALWRFAIEASFDPTALYFTTLQESYCQWLESPEVMEHFKDYFFNSFMVSYWTERDLGVKLDLSFEIQERSPTK